MGVGNTRKQIEAYKASFRVQFPIFSDEKGDVFTVIGGPAVPYMLMVTPSGKVVMTHDGLIEDMDGVLKKIRETHKQQ